MQSFDWGKRTYLMGVINITPDSFSGDGILSHKDPIKQATLQAQEFVQAGAHILDLGAESSRPGSHTISTEQELERLLPILEAIKSINLDAAISIDTCKSKTAQICLEEGADWINDIWGLHADTALANIIHSFGATVVLMHNRSQAHAIRDLGVIGKSYQGSDYQNLIEEIKADLSASIRIAKQAGIQEEKIILDPGIGFGKSVEQNLAIINHLDEFRCLGFPILIGPSRKSFIGQILDLPVEEREEGTAAAIAIGIARGADIIRVHNVRAMARVAKVSDAILGRLEGNL